MKLRLPTDRRTIGLLAALALTGLALAVPRLPLARDVFSLLAVVDITGSMNVRDMGSDDAPVTRLDAARSALRRLVGELPCQSRLGLGVFTERRSFVLVDPVETCENFAPLDQAIANLDWRMGWEGDSFVAKGVHHALGEAARVDSDLLFLTDGQEAPPLPPGGELPAFEGEPGKVSGAIVGVGAQDKSPIPKFDNAGLEIGVYGPDDVVQENRTGPPPKDAESRPGYHPKWAPFGSEPATGDEHLSSVRSEHLRKLATQTGLSYGELKLEPRLLDLVVQSARARSAPAHIDVRPLPAALALALIAAVYLASALGRARVSSLVNQSGSVP